MNRDDIVKWAQQWGDWNGQTVEFNDVGLERFAALVAAAERAACSDICDQHASIEGIAQRCAAAIRARKQA
jgi:hypothetical protein